MKIVLLLILLSSIIQSKKPKKVNNNWEDSLYLALLIEDSSFSKEIFSKLALLLINPTCKNNDFCRGTIINIINYKMKGIYKYPKSFHSTLYYKGNGEYDHNNLAYKEFYEDETVNINIIGIGILNEYIVTLLVKYSKYSNNTYKHITFMLTKSSKAVESNQFFDDIFSEGKYLNKEYLNEFEDFKGKAFIFEDIVLDEMRKVIFYSFDSILSIDSVMKGMDN